uniref:Uncharacterized protein n=1 Tax=Rhizophora mucronata TaxID=61149 RepID=A0A2P2QZA7_RHIMU
MGFDHSPASKCSVLLSNYQIRRLLWP